MPVLKRVPEPFDYVAGYFHDTAGFPRGKVRPLLVLKVIEDFPGVDVPVAIVAFCSSQSLGETEIDVTALSIYGEDSGFGKKFSYLYPAQIGALPLHEAYFPDCKDGRIVIAGRLDVTASAEEQRDEWSERLRLLVKFSGHAVNYSAVNTYRDQPHLFAPATPENMERRYASPRPPVGSYIYCRPPAPQNPWKPRNRMRTALVIGYGEDYGLDPDVMLVVYSADRLKPSRRYTGEHERPAIMNMNEHIISTSSRKPGALVDPEDVRAVPMNRKYFPQGMRVVGHLDAEGLGKVMAAVKTHQPMPHMEALAPSSFYDAKDFVQLYPSPDTSLDHLYDDSGFIELYRPIVDDDGHDMGGNGPAPC